MSPAFGCSPRPWLVCCGAARSAARYGRTRPDLAGGVVDERTRPAHRVRRAADPPACGGLRLNPAGRTEIDQRRIRGSITNVFLAACTLSLRAWLQRHDTVPDDPLLMQMPLALPDADPTAIGNP